MKDEGDDDLELDSDLEVDLCSITPPTSPPGSPISGPSMLGVEQLLSTIRGRNKIYSDAFVLLLLMVAYL